MIIDTLHLYTQDTTTVSEKYRHSDLLAELNRHYRVHSSIFYEDYMKSVSKTCYDFDLCCSLT
jgi:hypothetical protein